MTDAFRIARNSDPESTLPYILWVPLTSAPLVLKARETWPRTGKVYCHRGEPLAVRGHRPQRRRPSTSAECRSDEPTGDDRVQVRSDAVTAARLIRSRRAMGPVSPV